MNRLVALVQNAVALLDTVRSTDPTDRALALAQLRRTRDAAHERAVLAVARLPWSRRSQHDAYLAGYRDGLADARGTSS